jgi:putative DNA primase/helicase
VGEEHCSNVDLEEIEDLPLRARLATSRLNVCDESDTKSFTTKHINTIVSGKRIGARHLYKDAFEFRPTCKMVFAANRFPATRNYDEALYDRLLLLMLTNRFRNTSKQDPYLKEKLFAEAPGIFAWALVRAVTTCAAGAACCAPGPPWRRSTSTAGTMTPCASSGRSA